MIFETYIDAAQAVQDGRVHAFASVARAHEGFLKQNKALGLISVNVPHTEKPPAFGCFAFARRATDLRDRVDQVLNQFIGGAQHRRLISRFGFDSDDVDRLR